MFGKDAPESIFSLNMKRHISCVHVSCSVSIHLGVSADGQAEINCTSSNRAVASIEMQGCLVSIGEAFRPLSEHIYFFVIIPLCSDTVRSRKLHKRRKQAANTHLRLSETREHDTWSFMPLQSYFIIWVCFFRRWYQRYSEQWCHPIHDKFCDHRRSKHTKRLPISITARMDKKR